MGKRGRQTLVVDRLDMQRAITIIEKSGPLVNRSELWQKLSDSSWSQALQPRPMTPSVAYQRALQFEKAGCALTIKTPVGKKGGDGTFGGKRGRVAGKQLKKTGITEKCKAELIKKLGQSLLGTIEKADAGNLRAKVKLNCLVCAGCQRVEVTECQVTSCVFHLVRPYQRKDGKANYANEE